MSELERSTLAFRRFCGFSERDTVELTAFGGRQKLQVAYARTIEDQLRLLAMAEHQPELKGTYTVLNLVHEGLYARIGEGRWVPGAPRASDTEVTELRSVYIDFDAVRPRDISSTDAEKAATKEVATAVKLQLTEYLGTEHCFGLGDSGNGYSLFIAIEPEAPTKQTTASVQKFLKAIATKFDSAGVKVDPAVCNPARLCPAYGTMKRKGVNCAERPHRMTSFRCSENVTRIPLASIQ